MSALRLAAGFRKMLRPRNLAVCTALAGGLVCAETAYLQGTYRPLKPPTDGRLMQGLERAVPVEGGEQRVREWVRRLVKRASDENSPISTWVKRQKDTQTKRILIVGDSLVVGIGCKDAPVMPQVICRHLSHLLGVDIAWQALGINGGDVRTIHKNVLAAVEDFQTAQLQVRNLPPSLRLRPYRCGLHTHFQYV